MALAYSMDLRTRVLRDADAGLSSKALAERYHVSRAWVDALKQRRRETGAFAPRKPTKFRRRALAATDLHRLTAFLAARPDATREEIRRRFGDKVVEIVDGCTDADSLPKPPWKRRKEGYVAHIRSAPTSVRLVSACDKLQNARAILADYRALEDALCLVFLEFQFSD